jgi:DNA-binding Lrp family transcriptional regulator
MRTILVLIKCEMGKSYQVAAEISERLQLDVRSVSGEYDLIVTVHLEKTQDVGRFVCEEIQTIPHIRDTYTIVTFNAFTKDGGISGDD